MQKLLGPRACRGVGTKTQPAPRQARGPNEDLAVDFTKHDVLR